MSPASPREHARPNAGGRTSVWASRILSFAALALFAFAAFRDTSSTKSAPVYLSTTTTAGRKVRAFAEPWFCHGGPCAPFADEPKRGGPGYEARAYEPGALMGVSFLCGEWDQGCIGLG